MSPECMGSVIEILLVEDNPGDARLAMEALKDAKVRNNLHWVADGIEALAFLNQQDSYEDKPRPDVILLDLNLPRKNGWEVLKALKGSPGLRKIPVVVLTASKRDQDILKSYDLQASCYITKPLDLDQFLTVVKSIENFWLTIVRLPRRD